MSNQKAIATVTATLQKILEPAIQAEVNNAKVTTVRPDNPEAGLPSIGANIYLYQVTPNKAWQNNDLQSRKIAGALVKIAQNVVDLHYMITFYGNDNLLEPECLLGTTIRTFTDQSILKAEKIEETINSPAYNFLKDSDLAFQTNRVILLLSSLTSQEQSQIVSSFFQGKPPLYVLYSANMVLIEGVKPASRALPVRRAEIIASPLIPAIASVVPSTGAHRAIFTDSNLIIRGSQLWSERTKVRIGEATLTPMEVTGKLLKLDLSSLPIEEAQTLRAGVQSFQVIHIYEKRSRSERERVFGSNGIPIILRPRIIEINSSQKEDSPTGGVDIEVTVTIKTKVRKGQRVVLLLNQLPPIPSEVLRENETSSLAAYMFAAKILADDSFEVVFSVVDVLPGKYLVRVQVDGAESVLNVDTDRESPTFDQYVWPTVAIA